MRTGKGPRQTADHRGGVAGTRVLDL